MLLLHGGRLKQLFEEQAGRKQGLQFTNVRQMRKILV